MENCLSSILRFLPEVNSCCICIKNMKLAGFISSIVLFVGHNSTYFFYTAVIIAKKYNAEYYYKTSAIAVIQLIIMYIFTSLSIPVFLLNILMFFAFCMELQWCNVVGLLFVLLSLLVFFFEVILIFIAFIRGFIDPGVFGSPGFTAGRNCPGQNKTSNSISGVLIINFSTILPFNLMKYFLLIWWRA